MTHLGTSARSRLQSPTIEKAAANRLEKVVDLAAARYNLRVLCEAAGGRKVMAVVKGDAYGLGAVEIARTLVAVGVDALAVDTVAEGLELRIAGIETPILVMDVDVAQNAVDCVAANLMPTVARTDQASRYAAVGRRGGRSVTAWLRTNVGFNRFGPRENEGFGAVLAECRRHREELHVTGLFAHLSSSAWNEAETAAQAAAFANRLAASRASLGGHIEGSLAATHGLAHPAALRDTTWVRPGIGIYGLVAPTCRQLAGWAASGLCRLRPAWELRARILDIVAVTRAEGLGYDREAGVFAGQRVASVALGFSRGITSAVKGFTGLLHGRQCRLVGQPGMDCTQFDVSHVPEARVGDWMTMLGSSDGATLSAEAVSAKLGFSLYELMGTFRMPVRYVETACDHEREK